MDSHHSLLLLLPGSARERGRLDVTAQLLPTPAAGLPDHGVLPTVPRGIGGNLEPRPFSGPILSKDKLLRTF